jgi:shikimate kinase
MICFLDCFGALERCGMNKDAITGHSGSGRPIFLIGFMGAGKSTVGKALAKRLRRQFIDLDLLIEEKAGAPIRDIFAGLGEQAFRALELDAIKSLETVSNAVVALGGGSYNTVVNRDRLRGIGTTVWIDCPIEICWSRISSNVSRPLLGSLDEMERLLFARRPAYQEADLRIQVGRDSPGKVVIAIIEALGLCPTIPPASLP